MVWWKRDGKARQPEEPLPEPLPCPVCNGHAEAVIDMYTIGGYAGQGDFWGCRCSVCGYGFFGATGGPRSEREAISRWEILVRNTLDVIAEPLEECPKCHIAPEVKQNVVEGQRSSNARNVSKPFAATPPWRSSSSGTANADAGRRRSSRRRDRPDCWNES